MKITSSQNSHFKLWKELKSAKAIRESGQFFLMGEKLVREFLSWPSSHPARKKFLLEAEIIPENHFSFTADQVKKYELSLGLFKEVDFIGTGFNLLLLKFSNFEKADFSLQAVGLELVAPLGDPGNMGALVRSALAFGVKKIFLTKESCHPFHPRALKASAGASLLMNFLQTEKSFSEISVSQQDLFLDQNGTAVEKFKWPQHSRLWIGEEGPGISSVSKKFPSQIVSLKTENVESLNATVAASLAIYEWSKNLKN